MGSYLTIALSLFGNNILISYSLEKKDKGYLSNNNLKKLIKTIYDDILRINRYESRLKDLNLKL